MTAKTRHAFQAAGVVATAMVVAIHYRSAVPPNAVFGHASANALVQEFLLGGLSRIAVPLFALAAGLFYFASCDGSLEAHLQKLRQRVSTVLAPYLIVGAVALGSQVAIRQVEGRPLGMSLHELMLVWWLTPPAEQLWFLRDLILLALAAPLIGWLLERAAAVTLAALALLWLTNVQPFTLVYGWYLVNIETLLFFSVGAALATHRHWMEAVTHASPSWIGSFAVLWLLVTGVRVWMRPDFDLWYVHEYEIETLLLHQISIVLGVVTCLGWAGRATSSAWPVLSGLSFFVYLIHEYPLRAVVDRVTESTDLGPHSFWVTAPVVTIACYFLGWWFCRRFPLAFAIFTGGRTPYRALRIRSAPESSVPAFTPSH